MTELYMEFSKFQLKFPIETECFACGSQGDVYESKNIFAVKIFVDSMVDFVIEIDFLCRVSHPNILKPIAWSFDGFKGYLAMPLGKPITEIKDIQNAMIELKSAIDYLHSLNIVHGDIRLHNTISLNGKAVLIDFGYAAFSSDVNEFKHDLNCLDEIGQMLFKFQNKEYQSVFIDCILLSNRKHFEPDGKRLVNQCLSLCSSKNIDLDFLTLICDKIVMEDRFTTENKEMKTMIFEIMILTNCQVFSRF